MGKRRCVAGMSVRSNSCCCWSELKTAGSLMAWVLEANGARSRCALCQARLMPSRSFTFQIVDVCSGFYLLYLETTFETEAKFCKNKCLANSRVTQELYEDRGWDLQGKKKIKISTQLSQLPTADGGKGRNMGFAMFELTNCQCVKVMWKHAKRKVFSSESLWCIDVFSLSTPSTQSKQILSRRQLTGTVHRGQFKK